MVYFSDFFEIPEEKLQEFGAFNISLINDLPLFIDPFLLFGSDKVEYQKVHDEIINYLIFLKEKAATGTMSKAIFCPLFERRTIKIKTLLFFLYHWSIEYIK